MVNTNRGVQDPTKNCVANNVTANEMVIVTDSDIENEDNDYEGYQPLPGNVEDAVSEEESDEDAEASGVTSPAVKDLPDIIPIEQALLKEVWDTGVGKDIEMDSNKVDAVKKAMVNITLPPSSIPEWANNIPEEEWKATLLNKIQNYNKNI